MRSGSSWVLADAAWPHRGELIKKSAETLVGVNTAPASILLTHLHPDHAGSAAEPARAWNLPVYADPDELPLPTGKLAYSDPIGRVIGPLTGFLPEGEFEASLRIVTAADPGAGVPGLPDWERIPTPGHTPGHVSYFRASDRVLITGDALLTMNGSPGLLPLPGKRAISGPPRISTWNWAAATQSVARLARLEPRVLAPGHGTPMTTAATAAALRSFSDSLASEPRVAPGFFQPVDYSRRTRYRRPPDMYLRFQPLGTLLTTGRHQPGYVITLEVPGRRRPRTRPPPAGSCLTGWPAIAK